MKFYVNQTESKFSFTLTTDDGETLAISKTFTSQEDCIAAIRTLTTVLRDSSAYKLAGNKFSLLADGTVVAESGAYASNDAAQRGMQAIIDDASDEAEYSVEVTTQTESVKSKFVQMPSLSNIDYGLLYDFSISSDSKKAGFEPLEVDKNTYNFLYNDAQGQPLIFSRRFDTAGKRDKRIRQLISASKKAERFEIIEENGSFYFIMKARNQAEIARSKQFDDKAAAESAIGYVKETMPDFVKEYPQPAKRKKRGNVYNFDVRAESSKEGFQALRAEDKNHYFLFYDSNGQPILYSQGYTGKSSRDNGIKTVIRNASMSDQHEVKEEEGKYYFVLKSGNRQEIARSTFYTSKEEAQNQLDKSLVSIQSYADKYGVVIEETVVNTETNSFVINVDLPDEKSESNRNIDEYLGCDAYKGHEEIPADGFRTFKVEDEHYFVMLDNKDDVLLRSEGYPTKGARDNGLASVQKNRELTERYSVVESEGEYFVVLKAGNHQEIARSCPYESESSAMATFGFLSGTGSFPWLAAKGSNEDEYLDCDAYKNHDEVPADGFRIFKADGEYYFVMLDNKDDVLLRSEGYPTTGARDNGLASVQKNRELNDRYSVIEDEGEYFVILKAGNHKEIARSCPYESEAAAMSTFGFLSGTGSFPWLAAKKGNNEDEYLTCKAYKNHEDSPAEGFTVFKQDGEHYFAMIDDYSGEVLFRSEGYPTTGARDTGLASVQKNRDIKERYSIIEDEGEHFVILKAGNHKEIARSCPYDNEAALLLVFPFLGAGSTSGFPWEIAGAAALAATALGANAATSDSSDESIEETPIAAAAITPTPDVETPESIEKSEDSSGEMIGAAGVAGAAALAAASLNADDKDEVPGAVGAAAATGAVSPPPPAAVEPTAVAAASEGGGGAWGGIPRWLLALLAAILLALLFWWLLRGCNGTPSEVPIAAGEPAPIIAVDSLERDSETEALSNVELEETEPVVVEEPVEPKAAEVENDEVIGGVDCGCDTGKEPLFMRYAYEPKTLTKLGSNTEFGNSHALSPTEFYDKLNSAYYSNEVDRVFLDRIFRSMGYSAGWSAATASMFSNTTVPYGTVGNIGYGKDHRTQYSKLNLGDYDQQAFLIKSRNGCDIRFMKTCGNHMFYCTK